VEHVVFYTAADGSPAYRRTANLDDAVRVVEHLRNAEGREEVHVYSLASVALNFRPYYRVELNANAPIPAQPDSMSFPAAASPPAPVEAQQTQPAQPMHSALTEFASEPVSGAEPIGVPFQQVAAPIAYAEPVADQPQALFAPAAAASAPDPTGQFIPTPPASQPMPPVPEQQPAMAAAGQPGEDSDGDQNGQGRGRSLGFFTR